MPAVRSHALDMITARYDDEKTSIFLESDGSSLSAQFSFLRNGDRLLLLGCI